MKQNALLLCCALAAACSGANPAPEPQPSPAPAASTVPPQAQLPAPFATPAAVRFSTVVGWPAGKVPAAAPDLQVTLFADGLDSPRWLHVLPNGDVLVAESSMTAPKDIPPDILKGLQSSGMTKPSANRVTLLRDADRDGVPELRTVLLRGLNQPFGMLALNGSLYVANTDGLMRFPFSPGQTRIDGAGKKVLDLPAGGYNNHWTRNVIAKPDGSKLYVSVGSATNVDEEGIDVKDERRAAILEVNPDGSGMRVFAGGLRNPNGMDWEPSSNALWTAVNERDLLGDDLVPDYLTSVRDGGFYGWPYSYLGQNEDPRQKGKRPDLVAKAIVPDYPLGAHTASLGLVFSRGEVFPPAFRGGAFVAQHGSWNRSTPSGYRVLFVPFSAGRPSGPPRDVLTGFIANPERLEVHGRPVGLALAGDGALLVSDDAGGRIWLVKPNPR